MSMWNAFKRGVGKVGATLGLGLALSSSAGCEKAPLKHPEAVAQDTRDHVEKTTRPASPERLKKPKATREQLKTTFTPDLKPAHQEAKPTPPLKPATSTHKPSPPLAGVKPKPSTSTPPPLPEASKPKATTSPGKTLPPPPPKVARKPKPKVPALPTNRDYVGVMDLTDEAELIEEPTVATLGDALLPIPRATAPKPKPKVKKITPPPAPKKPKVTMLEDDKSTELSKEELESLFTSPKASKPKVSRIPEKPAVATSTKGDFLPTGKPYAKPAVKPVVPPSTPKVATTTLEPVAPTIQQQEQRSKTTADQPKGKREDLGDQWVEAMLTDDDADDSESVTSNTTPRSTSQEVDDEWCAMIDDIMICEDETTELGLADVEIIDEETDGDSETPTIAGIGSETPPPSGPSTTPPDLLPPLPSKVERTSLQIGRLIEENRRAILIIIALLVAAWRYRKELMQLARKLRANVGDSGIYISTQASTTLRQMTDDPNGSTASGNADVSWVALQEAIPTPTESAKVPAAFAPTRPPQKPKIEFTDDEMHVFFGSEAVARVIPSNLDIRELVILYRVVASVDQLLAEISEIEGSEAQYVHLAAQEKIDTCLDNLNADRNESRGYTGATFSRQLSTLNEFVFKITERVRVLHTKTSAQLQALRSPVSTPLPPISPVASSFDDETETIQREADAPTVTRRGSGIRKLTELSPLLATSEPDTPTMTRRTPAEAIPVPPIAPVAVVPDHTRAPLLRAPQLIDIRDIFDDEDESEAPMAPIAAIDVKPMATASDKTEIPRPSSGPIPRFRAPSLDGFFRERIPEQIAINDEILGVLTPKKEALRQGENRFSELQRELQAAICRAEGLLETMSTLVGPTGFHTYFDVIIKGLSTRRDMGRGTDRLDAIRLEQSAFLKMEFETILADHDPHKDGLKLAGINSEWGDRNTALKKLCEVYQTALETVKGFTQRIAGSIHSVSTFNDSLSTVLEGQHSSLNEAGARVAEKEAEVRATWEEYVSLSQSVDHLIEQLQTVRPSETIGRSAVLESPSLDICQRLEYEKGKLFSSLSYATLTTAEAQTLKSDLIALAAQFEVAEVYFGRQLKQIKQAIITAEKELASLKTSERGVVDQEKNELSKSLAVVENKYRDSFVAFVGEYEEKRAKYKQCLREIDGLEIAINLATDQLRPTVILNPIPDLPAELNSELLDSELKTLRQNLESSSLTLGEIIAAKKQVEPLKDGYHGKSIKIMNEHLAPLETELEKAEAHLAELKEYTKKGIVDGSSANNSNASTLQVIPGGRR